MVDRALTVLDIDSGIAAALKACNSTIKINFPCRNQRQDRSVYRLAICP